MKRGWGFSSLFGKTFGSKSYIKIGGKTHPFKGFFSHFILPPHFKTQYLFQIGLHQRVLNIYIPEVHTKVETHIFK